MFVDADHPYPGQPIRARCSDQVGGRAHRDRTDGKPVSPRLRFGGADTPEPLSAGFAELREAVAAVVGWPDVDTLTEVLWAALHGLTTLSRNER